MWSLPIDKSTRVWLYSSTRSFTMEETAMLEAELNGFVQNWKAHDKQLKAFGKVIFNRVLLLAVDEKLYSASGCSIDKSIHFIQDLSNRYNSNFFDRELVAFKGEEGWSWVNFKEVKGLLDKGSITANTPVLDITRTQFASEEELIKPLKMTWLSRYLANPVPNHYNQSSF